MHEWKKRFSRTAGAATAATADTWKDLVLHVGDERPFMSTFTPVKSGTRLAEVFRRHCAHINALLDERGALLFRGFEVGGARELELLGQWVGHGACESREETSPRSHIAGNVYTATEYPGRYPIAFHNECSYQKTMPAKLLFYCGQPSHTGGATLLADGRAVWRALPEPVKASFAGHGYRLMRTYHPNFGMSWRQAFGVNDRASVEAMALSDGISLEWKSNDVLTTTQTRPCVGIHPRTGKASWINHLYFFHHSNLPEHARQALLTDAGADLLVNDTCHADGTPIALDTLAAIGQAYEANTLSVEWQAGDVLLVDNLCVAHGRTSYEGVRTLYFAQLDRVEWAQLHNSLLVQEEHP
ncbi:TauD/TfdA family dioxygenase [Pseudomonas amygdali]|uniref:TauD/TfdA family dioxygenase n=1 Tax=Pseudomonas amygdali TaxID=47877 RepID=UPI000710685D|nr:TauD/TfdA family dioxygenase [Pseudomonas amygdali]PPS32327.1 hypothetical protein BVY10_07905 [Pseudomonas amygdali pv. morsprunorum]UBT81292.1 TauD/TfdA family dioxygenase [Pseudomonas amygdali]